MWDRRYFLPIILVEGKNISCETFVVINSFQRCDRMLIQDAPDEKITAFNSFKKYMTKSMIKELERKKKLVEVVIVYIKVDSGCPCGDEGPCYHKIEGL